MNYKISRRQFLWKSSLLTTGLAAGSSKLLANQKPAIRFGLAADSHYADREPNGKRFYRGALEKVREFVEVMNEEQVDFVMHLGDFKDEDPGKQEVDTLRYLKDLEDAYGQFKGPRYHCVGNHDVDSITKQQFLANVENTGISKDMAHFSYDRRGFHFVVLDANFHPDGRDHFFKEGANWQDVNLPTWQLEWLKEDLSRAQSPVIVFCHHPLYEYYRGGNKFHVNQYKQAQEVMENSGKVVAVIQGHVHDEQHKEINGIHYFTQLAMVEYQGLENNSFSIVEITPDLIKIKGYKRVADQQWEVG